MKVVFLASEVTLPGSPTRRPDAFEHDYQVNAIKPELASRGAELLEASWNDQSIDWSDFDAAIIGTTWDYWDHHEAFLTTLEQIEAAGTPLFNSSKTVRWNSRKTYLKDLEQRGALTIPTLWLTKPKADELAQAFDKLNSDDVVIKRQVGAGAQGQLRVKRGDTLSDYAHDAMIQPFLPTIQSEGEYSFIMIDGALSHCLVKRAKQGDYRIQSMYGGVETPVEPTSEDLKAARDVIATLDETPLYTRVDMVRGDDGRLLLMELEMIEPYLYPEQGPKLGPLFAEALVARLNKG